MNQQYLLKQRKHIFLLWVSAIILCLISIINHLSQHHYIADITNIAPISHLSDDKLAQIRHITIKNDANNIDVDVKKIDDQWRVDAIFPANSDKISDLLRILQQGRLISPKTNHGDDYQILGLDHINATQIAYYDNDNQLLFGLDIGARAKIGDGRYIRISGDTQSYLSDINYDTTTRREMLGLPNVNMPPQKITIDYSDGRNFQRHSRDDIANDDFHQLELARTILQPKFLDMAMIDAIKKQGALLAQITLSADSRTIEFYQNNNDYYFIYDNDDFAYHINDGDGALLAEGEWDKYKNKEQGNATN